MKITVSVDDALDAAAKRLDRLERGTASMLRGIGNYSVEQQALRSEIHHQLLAEGDALCKRLRFLFDALAARRRTASDVELDEAEYGLLFPRGRGA